MIELTPASPPTASVHAGATIRVLVVEDSIDHQMLMVRRLRAAGMKVTAASNAQDALASLDGVDLVLLDYRLPGTSGIEVLEAIQQRESAPSVIMVTGTGSIDVAVDAMRAGAIDYLAKGAGYLDALPEVVRRAWRHHDLAARATELQRLALLVSSATDRDELFGEIVSGARRLLRASSCVLMLGRHGRLTPVTVLGPTPDDLNEVLASDRGLDAGAGEVVAPWTEDGRMLVPLPRDGGMAVGMLAVWRRDDGYGEGDLELARTFASFAGMALRNLRQRELELQLVDELQQTVDARRDFIASISHELRTPLTCISGFAQTLQEHSDVMPEEQRADMMQRIMRNAGDLHALVDDLIHLAALDRGHSAPVALRPYPLDTLVRQCIGDAEEILADRVVTIDVPHDVVMADPVLLRRTVGNLLTNAVKFSASGSRIDVRGTIDGGRVRVEVQDQGIGLEPREAARVFDPFFRAVGSVANAVRGSGIGLALVKEYVRTMDGAVGVSSEPGVGSTFWFTLLLAPTNVAPADVVPGSDQTQMQPEAQAAGSTGGFVAS